MRDLVGRMGDPPVTLGSWLVLIGGILIVLNCGMVFIRLAWPSDAPGIIDPILHGLFRQRGGAAPVIFRSIWFWLAVFMGLLTLAGLRLVWTSAHIFGAQSGQLIGGLAWIGMGLAALGLRLALYEEGRRQRGPDSEPRP